jgi:hypothetical protein
MEPSTPELDALAEVDEPHAAAIDDSKSTIPTANPHCLRIRDTCPLW